jgi:hypothetical protein
MRDAWLSCASKCDTIIHGRVPTYNLFPRNAVLVEPTLAEMGIGDDNMQVETEAKRARTEEKSTVSLLQGDANSVIEHKDPIQVHQGTMNNTILQDQAVPDTDIVLGDAQVEIGDVCVDVEISSSHVLRDEKVNLESQAPVSHSESNKDYEGTQYVNQPKLPEPQSPKTLPAHVPSLDKGFDSDEVPEIDMGEDSCEE